MLYLISENIYGFIFFNFFVEQVFIEIVISKVNPIPIWAFYRLSNSNIFTDTFSNDFKQIGIKKSTIFLFLKIFQDNLFLKFALILR